MFDIKDLRKNIENLKIAVIGDYCLDQYWYMDSKFDKKLDYTNDIVFALTDIVYCPGGAGNVANNFVKLGANVKCVGLIGDDGPGYQLIKCLENINVNVDNMIRIQEKETHTCVRPIRIINNKNIALNEILTFKFEATSKETESQIKNILKNIINEVDVFVLVEQFDDNNKGIFTDNVREEIIRLAEIYREKIFIVDSRKYINKYRNIYLKCNKNEFIETLSNVDLDETHISELSRNLKEFKALFVTCGENGMKLIDYDGTVSDIPAIKVEQEVNTCGAGDSATVGIVIGLYSNYDAKKSALLGNIIASITIKDLESTGYPTYEKLVETLKNNNLIKSEQYV